MSLSQRKYKTLKLNSELLSKEAYDDGTAGEVYGIGVHVQFAVTPQAGTTLSLAVCVCVSTRSIIVQPPSCMCVCLSRFVQLAFREGEH